jgi:hypothetical protein
MRSVLVFIPILVAGCATPHPVAMDLFVPTGSIPQADAHVVVTRYELGTYRYPREASKPTEPTVFRRTRVSNDLIPTGSDPRAVEAPPTLDPLPPSAELAAELAAQRDITARIRASQERIVGLERQARTQFETLVAQTETTVQLRRQLEAERARVQSLEVRPRDDTRFVAPSSPVVPVTTPAPATEQKPEW